MLETLTLREAKESSAIENIISTFAEVYQSSVYSNLFASPEAKEVHLYAEALKQGFNLIQSSGLLTNNHILKIQSVIEQNDAGFRKVPGTKLLNENTGEVVYMPPQDALEIESLMQNLEAFINNDELADIDPLIKMAIIHHQFETIHPFYDGNGRTGRIILLLYLKMTGLLDLPALYLSNYIIQHKDKYYTNLRKVTEEGNWEDWIMYMLDMVEKTAVKGRRQIAEIEKLMNEMGTDIQQKLPKIYSKELLEELFRLPYTKRNQLEKAGLGNLKTVGSYLKELENKGFLKSEQVGKEKLYLNFKLLEVLSTK